MKTLGSMSVSVNFQSIFLFSNRNTAEKLQSKQICDYCSGENRL